LNWLPGLTGPAVVISR